jgi:DNA-directed RNA polymerase
MTTDYVSYLEGEGLDSISLDKMTLEDRAKWSELCEDFLINTEQLCEEAEKPFSFAAICNEIREYRKAVNSGNTYHSGFPIPLDGSNNGWQHLAAMSKDAQAGELVSLTAAPIQKDFYVAVAKQLITLMPDWFEERQIPMKHIRKGIAKRGSMTRAYSAGKRRIAKNMYDDCHMEGFTSKYNIDEDQCMVLAGNLIDAINTVCNGPLKTTKFLQKLAEHELSSGQNMIQWVTPSGFPVRYKANLQHERKQRGTIKGIPGNSTGRITHVIKVDATNKETGEKVPCRKSFASGISPNVVHSYDAAHMANTIVAFGGSFAAVHDSFSTHACDVDFLQEVTKLTFIAQYNVDNFFDIIKEVMMTPESRDTFKWPAPSLGKLNIEDINDSKYFFC